MKTEKSITLSFIIFFAAIAAILYSVCTYRYWGRNLPFNMNRAKAEAESYMEALCKTDFDVTDACACNYMGVHGYEVKLTDKASGVPAVIVFDVDLRAVRAEFPPGNELMR